MNYWLMKSEPNAFSIDDLKRKHIEPWDGVRNYQARNMLRDQMQRGDQAFFYHSNCPIPGIVGIMEVIKAGYPDSTAFDPSSQYFDPSSNPENPRWYRVDVRFIKRFTRIIRLDELKQHSFLQTMQVTKKGNRLSITPVSVAEWQVIIGLAQG